jgi:hypothetical protein
MVYSDPKLPQTWSDLEVADTWLKVFPGKYNDPKFKKTTRIKNTKPSLKIQSCWLFIVSAWEFELVNATDQ